MTFLCYDLKGIQSFIFAVPRLRYICGGSAIIDRFDREVAPAAAKESGGAELVFSGGGKGAYRCAEAVAADRIQERLRNSAREDGLTICFGRHENYAEAARVATRTFPWLPVGAELEGQPCPSSGLFPTLDRRTHPVIARRQFARGERNDRYFEERLALSPEFGLKGKLSFVRNVSGRDRDDPDADRDGEAGARAFGSRNRWAVIAMDGNDVGAQHRRAHDIYKGNDARLGEWLRRMSAALDACTAAACKAGMREVLRLWAMSCGDEVDGARVDDVQFVPLRPLVVGGDDIVLLCHARFATEFVIKAATEFERLAREEAVTAKKQGFDLWPASDGKLTISAGILFASVTVPLASAIPYAESLLASAKGGGRRLSGGRLPSPSCVDFEMVTESVLDTPSARRKRELQFHDGDDDSTVELTRRPYELRAMNDLLEMADAYQDVPTTIRHQILAGMRASRWDRKAFVARLGKRGALARLVSDLEEGGGRWKERLTGSARAVSTDVVDALQILEECARMDSAKEAS